MAVSDVQLARVPVLKQKIVEWRLGHGMGPIPEEGKNVDDLLGRPILLSTICVALTGFVICMIL